MSKPIKIPRPAELTKEYLQKEYVELGRDIPEIAKRFNLYPNAIYRLMKKWNIPRRNRNDTQQLLFKRGKKKSPMEGKKQTETHKDRISQTRLKQWKQVSDEELERRRQIGKELWNKKKLGDLHDMRRLAGQATQRASKEGSKTEKFIKESLESRGWTVKFHPCNLVHNQRELEVDLFLPEIATAIEIDGVTHYEPIYGEERYLKQIENDNVKNGKLTAAGFNVIRVKHVRRRLTKAYHKAMLLKLLTLIEMIKDEGISGEIMHMETIT